MLWAVVRSLDDEYWTSFGGRRYGVGFEVQGPRGGRMGAEGEYVGSYDGEVLRQDVENCREEDGAIEAASGADLGDFVCP